MVLMQILSKSNHDKIDVTFLSYTVKKYFNSDLYTNNYILSTLCKNISTKAIITFSRVSLIFDMLRALSVTIVLTLQP